MLYKDRYQVETSRLKNWDYSSPGYYFLTICVKDREHHFGNIENGKIILSDIGNVAAKCWNEIPQQFPFAHLDEYIIMPNHLHGIIVIEQASINRGVGDISRDAINRVSTKNSPMLNQKGISYIIRWYKGRVSH